MCIHVYMLRTIPAAPALEACSPLTFPLFAASPSTTHLSFHLFTASLVQSLVTSPFPHAFGAGGFGPCVRSPSPCRIHAQGIPSCSSVCMYTCCAPFPLPRPWRHFLLSPFIPFVRCFTIDYSPLSFHLFTASGVRRLVLPTRLWVRRIWTTP